MCGRFTLRTSAAEVANAFDLPLFAGSQVDWAPRYNIAPTQSVLAICHNAENAGAELKLMHWGLIPSWADDPSIGGRMINARGETVREKPSFRGPFKSRRCLIPADGFYEWEKAGKKKLPLFFSQPSDRIFAFAGLWERWKKGDTPIESCTIITTAANAVFSPYHDRMPVILAPETYAEWLDPTTDLDHAVELMQSSDSQHIQVTPVSDKVNSPRLDSADCIEPRP